MQLYCIVVCTFHHQAHILELTVTQVLSGAFTSSEPTFPPGLRQGYSSSNYVLLGLLLASHAGARKWQARPEIDQLWK